MEENKIKTRPELKGKNNNKDEGLCVRRTEAPPLRCHVPNFRMLAYTAAVGKSVT